VTGANGFIGKNLVVRLQELTGFEVTAFTRGDDLIRLSKLVEEIDVVIHLAGENRPKDEAAFSEVNTGLTLDLCHILEQQFLATKRKIPLILTSSLQAEYKNSYGLSKLSAELAVQAFADATENPCVIFRLPGVFGKWCKPNYNSVVATFSYNLARGLPIQISDPSTLLKLVYVDDVVNALIAAMDNPKAGCVYVDVGPQYAITVGELADQIRSFEDCRNTLMIERVGKGLVRALYSTYVSYLPKDRFVYDVPQHADKRGVFVEILKTQDSGQFSYFTALPGVTRGEHYHHSKTEKFLVLKGEALFRFRHLLNNEVVELHTTGAQPQVVDSIPGWVHDITNIGTEEMMVMLWANENFDRQRPDTVSSKVKW
jgi:UDP-2-acetamido-2,6-beta-L-arabino-hexul-4-ose reductase